MDYNYCSLRLGKQNKGVSIMTIAVMLIFLVLVFVYEQLKRIADALEAMAYDDTDDEP